MQTTATHDEKMKLVYDCLVDGLPYFPSFGLEMDYNEGDYGNAKVSLAARMPADDICREDVWAEIVRNGGDLIFTDAENDGEEVGRLNITTINKNWDAIPARHMADYLSENYDANTTDCIIQSLLFGEIVYG